jgi:hypothetical protein
MYFKQHLGIVEIQIESSEIFCSLRVLAVPKNRFDPISLIEESVPRC